MYMWTTTQPLFWLFYVLTVVELSRLVLERYKGLYSIFRVAVIVSTVVSVTVSALSLIPKIKPTSPQRSKILGLFLVSERGLELSLALFIILILLFLSRYPVVLSRNVRAHAVIYAVYFLANTMGLLIRSLWGLRQANGV